LFDEQACIAKGSLTFRLNEHRPGRSRMVV